MSIAKLLGVEFNAKGMAEALIKEWGEDQAFLESLRTKGEFCESFVPAFSALVTEVVFEKLRINKSRPACFPVFCRLPGLHAQTTARLMFDPTELVAEICAATEVAAAEIAKQ